MSSRRQARKQAIAPQIPIREDTRRVYRIRCQTKTYGLVTVTFRGPEPQRLHLEMPMEKLGGKNFLIRFWDPEQFSQVMADPEIYEGLRRSAG